MDNKVIILMVLWMLLAILNIVSLFVSAGFLTVCNFAFGVINLGMVAAMVPQLFGYLKDKENGV